MVTEKHGCAPGLTTDINQFWARKQKATHVKGWHKADILQDMFSDQSRPKLGISNSKLPKVPQDGSAAQLVSK